MVAYDISNRYPYLCTWPSLWWTKDIKDSILNPEGHLSKRSLTLKQETLGY